MNDLPSKAIDPRLEETIKLIEDIARTLLEIAKNIREEIYKT